MRKSILAAGVCLAIGTLMSGATVSAETQLERGRRLYNTRIVPASNPYTALRALSDSQEAAVKAYLLPAKIRSTGSRLPRIGDPRQFQPSGCYEQTYSVSAQAALGNTLWRFYQSTSWCWANWRITSHHTERWGTTHALFWEFQGVTERSGWGGVGQTTVGAFAQGHFQMCIVRFGVGCPVSNDPWIRQEFRAGYTTGVESGGA